MWCNDCNNLKYNCTCVGETVRLEVCEVPKPILQVIFDLAVGSMDFGSGFWEQEDIDSARHLALLLGVCPNEATPRDMLGKYPECEGTKLWRKEWEKNFKSTIVDGIYGHKPH